MLGAYPLGAGPRVPQAAREGRSRPASRDAFPLVLRPTVHAARRVLAECGLSCSDERIYHCGLLLCFYLPYLFGNSPQSRHIVVASVSTSSYSSLFACELFGLLNSTSRQFGSCYFFSCLFVVGVAWLMCVLMFST